LTADALILSRHAPAKRGEFTTVFQNSKTSNDTVREISDIGFELNF
jgi:hypothetical protein